MRQALPLLPALLALSACAGVSDVAQYEDGSFGLTTTGATAASAARRGVEQAEAHCAGLNRVMVPSRSQIGRSDYRIAFRCLAPTDPALRRAGGP